MKRILYHWFLLYSCSVWFYLDGLYAFSCAFPWCRLSHRQILFVPQGVNKSLGTSIACMLCAAASQCGMSLWISWSLPNSLTCAFFSFLFQKPSFSRTVTSVSWGTIHHLKPWRHHSRASGPSSDCAYRSDDFLTGLLRMETFMSQTRIYVIPLKHLHACLSQSKNKL